MWEFDYCCYGCSTKKYVRLSLTKQNMFDLVRLSTNCSIKSNKFLQWHNTYTAYQISLRFTCTSLTGELLREQRKGSLNFFGPFQNSQCPFFAGSKILTRSSLLYQIKYRADTLKISIVVIKAIAQKKFLSKLLKHLTKFN